MAALPVCLLVILTVLAVLLLAPGCGPQTAPPTSTATSGSGPVTSAMSVSSTTGAPQPEETTTTSSIPEVVKIGALFPLSGDLASEGESALKGMRLAVEEINTAGGIASLGGIPLTLVEADSKGDVGTADDEVIRLTENEGVVAIVGTAQSTVAFAATEAAERLETPFVISTGAADEVTDRDLEYTFRLCPKAEWYARDQVAFLEALKDLAGPDVSTVALLYEDGDYGKQTAESQRAYLAKAGIEVVADIEYSPEKADVHNEILQIRQSGAQALLTATFLSDAALIAQDLDVLRVDMPVIDAAGGVLDPSFVTEAGEASEGIMSVALFAKGIAPARDLEMALSGAGDELDAGALYGYQAVRLLASALERGGHVDGPQLRLALATSALYGEGLVLPQSLLTFDGTGQNRGARLLVVQVQDGKMVTVWPEEYAEGAIRLH